MHVLKKVGIATVGALILTVAVYVAGGKASTASADPGPYWPQLPAYCVQYQYQLQWQLQAAPGQWQFIAGFWQFVPGYAQWVQVPVPVCVRYGFIINQFRMAYPRQCSPYTVPWANLVNCYRNPSYGMGFWGVY
jgi:hypothetical protein